MKVSSPIFSTMTGKLGGAVAATARGGVQYMRALVIPNNPKSFAQSLIRSIQTTISASWVSVLTDAQRNAWEALAGSTESGIDVLVKANSNRMLGGAAFVAAAPASVALPVTPVASYTATTAASVLTVTPATAVPANTSCNVFVSSPQRASRLSQSTPFRYAGTIAAAGTSLVVPVGHPARTAAAGQVVYVRIVMWGNSVGTAGQVASDQTFRCVVA